MNSNPPDLPEWAEKHPFWHTEQLFNDTDPPDWYRYRVIRNDRIIAEVAGNKRLVFYLLHKIRTR